MPKKLQFNMLYACQVNSAEQPKFLN